MTQKPLRKARRSKPRKEIHTWRVRIELTSQHGAIMAGVNIDVDTSTELTARVQALQQARKDFEQWNAAVIGCDELEAIK